MCKAGGLCLHKFVSNFKKVIDSVPPEDQAKGLKDLHLGHDALPVERTIEVLWCVESDTLQFGITLQGKPMTRLDKLVPNLGGACNCKLPVVYKIIYC